MRVKCDLVGIVQLAVMLLGSFSWQVVEKQICWEADWLRGRSGERRSGWQISCETKWYRAWQLCRRAVEM